MICLLLLQIAALTSMTWDMHSPIVRNIVQSLIIRVIITMVILFAEAVVYRILQGRLDRPTWVWTHIATLYFIIILIPLSVFIFNLFIVNQIRNGDQFEWARR